MKKFQLINIWYYSDYRLIKQTIRWPEMGTDDYCNLGALLLPVSM